MRPSVRQGAPAAYAFGLGRAACARLAIGDRMVSGDLYSHGLVSCCSAAAAARQTHKQCRTGAVLPGAPYRAPCSYDWAEDGLLHVSRPARFQDKVTHHAEESAGFNRVTLLVIARMLEVT